MARDRVASKEFSKRSEPIQNRFSFFRVTFGVTHFPLLIFLASLLLTVALWDAYFNSGRNDIVSEEIHFAGMFVLIMGTLFSISAGLFTWSLESRKGFLEREVGKRTKELRKKNEELSGKNQEIENLVHIISHDLKAPLVSIQGFVGLIREHMGPVDRSILESFSRIQANVRQMNELICDLLEFSRIGHMEEERELVSLESLITDILAELKPEIEKKQISVHVEGTLPSVRGSRKRLEQVFMNLIQNAVKYIGNKENRKIEIISSENRRGEYYQISVKDNGLGIKKEFQEKIFQMFQRAPSTKHIEGSGVGLSIVRKIVEKYGGETWVESEEGAGSEFFVRLPITQSKTAPLQKAA